ncbi:MAG: RecX family transcriptional regulator [Clostridia bacterium]|nr:RecX family transcriptional regulator [Clostridia bacterium]
MKIQIVHAAALKSGGVSIRVRITNGEQKESRSVVLSELDWARMALKVGAELGEEQYDELESAAEYYEAMRRGTELLSYGANSRAVLVTKLRRRGYDRETAERVAAQLYERGYINESADAEGIVRACLSRGYGKKRIIMKLRERGYENAVICEVLDSFENVDFTANCAEMIRKKYKKLPEERAELDKLIAAMVRYGYSYGEIKGALELCNI